jgi:deoxyadenosine/deoxycytidine kinase
VDAPVPDLVIYLQAPVDVLLRRIARRGISYERRIDAAYLRRLSEAYARLFLYYEAAPLLIVNAAHIDLVDNDEDYLALVERIHASRGGRHYFNPSLATI